MPNYRIEALLRHTQPEAEDQLEEKLLGFLYEIGAEGVQIVAFQVRPAMEP